MNDYARWRESGSLIPDTDPLGVTYVRLQARQHDSFSELEKREEPITRGLSCNVFYDDREQIGDGVGNRGVAHSCSHFSRPVSKIENFFSNEEVPITDPTILHTVWPDWVTYGYKYAFGGNGKYPFSAHLGNASWQPTFEREIDWTSMAQSAGNALDGQMQARTNILVEMAQLEQTIRMIKNPFGLLSANWRRSRKTLRQLTKAGANVWLEQKYGWQNFMRDFECFTSMLRKSRDHVNYLNRTKDSWASVGQSQTDDVTCTVPYPIISTPYYSIQRECSNVRAKRTAAFSLQLKRGSAFHVLSAREYYFQGVGADKMIEALWDLVPFSFVVDWFIDIGNVIKLNPIFWNQHQLRYVCHSVKTSISCDYSFTNIMPADGLVDEQYNSLFLPDQKVLKTYVRTAGFPPDTYSAGIFGELTMTHLGDLSALVAQRVL